MDYKQRWRSMNFLFVLIALYMSFVINSCSILSNEPNSSTSISGITITGSNTQSAALKVASATPTKTPHVPVFLYKKDFEHIVVDSTWSDTEGNFKFTNVAYGSYIVVADINRKTGGIHRGIHIDAINKRNDTLQVKLDTYVIKEVNLEGKSISSMSYFHFNIPVVENKYMFPALNGQPQSLLVKENIGSLVIDQLYYVLNIEIEITISLILNTPISSSSTFSSSSLLSSSSQQVPMSSFSPLSSNIELSSSSQQVPTSSFSPLSSSIELSSSSQQVPTSSFSPLSSSVELSSSSQTVPISSISLPSSSSVLSSSQNNALIAYWTFEDNLNNEVAGIAPGTAEGVIGYSEGVNGKGLTFDGYGERVVVPENTTDFELQELTVSAWFKLDRLNDNQEIFNNHNSKVSGTRNGMSIFVSTANKLQFALATHGGTVWSELITDDIIVQDSWYHVVCTFDGITQSMYLNGALVKTQSVNSPILYTTIAPTLGASRDEYVGTVRYLGGIIDEVKVYNYAISAQSALTEYERFNLQLVPGNALVAEWKFEGDLTNEVAGIDPGTTQGGVTYSSGVVGQAIDLDGTTASVYFPNNISDFELSQFSIMGWAKVNSLGNYQVIWENALTLSGGAGHALAFEPSGKLYLSFWNGADWDFARSPTALDSNEWYHIAGTFDGSTINLYVNSVLIDSIGVASSVQYGSIAGRFGEDPTGNSSVDRALDGTIDEIKIYNYALNGITIFEDMTNGNQ